MVGLVICHVQKKGFIAFSGGPLDGLNCCLGVLVGQLSKVSRLFANFRSVKERAAYFRFLALLKE